MNKRIFCVFKDIRRDDELEIFLSKYDSEDAEIQFFNVTDIEFTMTDILLWQDNIWPKREKEYEYSFITNIRTLTEYIYHYFKEDFTYIIEYGEERSDYQMASEITELDSLRSENIKSLMIQNLMSLRTYGQYDNSIIIRETRIKEMFNEATYYLRKQLLQTIKTLLGEDTKADCYIYSALLHLEPTDENLSSILTYIIENQHLSWKNKYSLLYQISGITFVNTECRGLKNDILKRKLYKQIVDNARRECSLDLQMRSKKEREEEKVVVITSQFLTMEHGPTKTALDRCYTLVKEMNKKIHLINTCELYSMAGMVPFFKMISANEFKEYAKFSSVEYKDVCIPYYQCSNMPDMPLIKQLITEIYAMNPCYIVVIGGNSILADILDQYIPTITIGTVPSELPSMVGSYQVIGRSLNEIDRTILKELGESEEKIITGLFTSTVKQQISHYTRTELGISENGFSILVVGARLTDEVTEEFIQTLLDAIGPEDRIVFAGCMNNYSTYINKVDHFEERTRYLGFQQDMLAVLDCCDLYVNPNRIGGGTSVAEALYKGVPAVTLPIGDVALGAGDDFIVESYDEMKETIKRYAADKEFYEMQSKKAKLRAEKLMDTDGAFVQILEEAVSKMR